MMKRRLIVPVLLRSRRGSYLDKVMGYGPAVYHPLEDTSGTAAVDLGAVKDGLYVNNPALAQAVDPFTCPVFDGVNQFINLGTTTEFKVWIQNNFNLYSLSVWVKVADWTSTTAQGVVFAEGAGPAFLRIQHPNVSRRFTALHYTAGAGYTFLKNDVTDGWHHFVMSVDYAETDVQFYWDGAPAGNSATVGEWTVSPSFVVYAATTNVPHGPINGSVAHVAWWNRVLLPAEAADLAAV